MGVSLKQLRAQKVLRVIGEIEIYDINCKENQDRRKAIFDYIVNIIKNKPEDKDVEILGREVIKNVLPVLTNVLLDELSDEEINEILEEPSDELIQVNRECSKIINNIIRQIGEELEYEAKKNELDKSTSKNVRNDKVKLLSDLKDKEEARKIDELETKKAELESKKAELKAQLEALENEE
jgi:tRNA U55 pseudouridine synthase TruB